MLSRIEDLEKIENQGMNSDTGEDTEGHDYLLTRVNIREHEAIPQMQVDSIKDCSFLFKKTVLDDSDVTVFEENKYLVNDMVIQDWRIMRKLPKQTILGGMEVKVQLEKHFRVPFPIGQFDFVIASTEKDFSLVNVDDGTRQIIVKCDSIDGFCITTEEGKAFDFHFTSSN